MALRVGSLSALETIAEKLGSSTPGITAIYRSQSGETVVIVGNPDVVSEDTVCERLRGLIDEKPRILPEARVGYFAFNGTLEAYETAHSVDKYKRMYPIDSP